MMAAAYRSVGGTPIRAPEASARSRPTRVAIIWRSFLPYSRDRLQAATALLRPLGIDPIGIQVSAEDPAYAFLGGGPSPANLLTCIEGRRFQDLPASAIDSAVQRALDLTHPAAVFAPATPFVEGMAAIRWCRRNRRRVFLMDDAWEATDPRGWLVRAVKSMIHECIDGVLVPHASYRSYWHRLHVPAERVIPGLDVLDNARFARPAGAPEPGGGFLFVGRDLPRKGLQGLLLAYADYRLTAAVPWPLTVVGPIPASPAAGVAYRGVLTGESLKQLYWQSRALVVPSDYDQWGLVVNEAMAAGLPVIASATVGAARALIRDDECGWLCRPRDPGALAARLRHVAALPEATWRAISTAAATKVNRDCPVTAFAHGLVGALALTPREPPSWRALAALRLWRGRSGAVQ